jgi:hypothetical protein
MSQDWEILCLELTLNFHSNPPFFWIQIIEAIAKNDKMQFK